VSARRFCRTLAETVDASDDHDQHHEHCEQSLPRRSHIANPKMLRCWGQPGPTLINPNRSLTGPSQIAGGTSSLRKNSTTTPAAQRHLDFRTNLFSSPRITQTPPATLSRSSPSSTLTRITCPTSRTIYSVHTLSTSAAPSSIQESPSLRSHSDC